MEKKCITDVKRLKKLMVDRGYDTKTRLSTASGVDRNTLGDILNGKKQPSSSVMYKLVETLNMTPSIAGEIFFNDNLRNAKADSKSA